MGINWCRECWAKQEIIDRLTVENQSLKERLRDRQRKEREGFFGSSTPSSKLPVKPNSPAPEHRNPRGGQPGHRGCGRKTFTDADRIVDVPDQAGTHCPDCGSLLRDKGTEERPVVESEPLKARKVLYRLPKKYCSRCRKTFTSSAPGVLPKSLYGNQLISTAATMHYIHGIPMGRICEQIGIGQGSMVEIFHRLARLFAGTCDQLIGLYRQSPVKHADETGWRTEGINGYAWLFATDRLSIFQFRKTRSAQVAKAVFGEKKLPGVLVVDRYAGYNKTPCDIQYCYAHLLREVEDLEKEFPDSTEVKTFVNVMAPLLSLAMALRNQPIADEVFYAKAAGVKSEIVAAIEAPAQHAGIRYIQNIFHQKENRMYHWSADRRVPAHNNLAERDLRPTVIARKVSFGSQSDAGAHTRGILMSVLCTLRKQQLDVASELKRVLDLLAEDISRDPFHLLLPNPAILTKPPETPPPI
ncbi:IS66 family transposase [Candidatus Auribacterota bacterium]